VTENERIPEIEEIVDAQLFAGRLVAHAEDYRGLLDLDEVDRVAAVIVAGGQAFCDNGLRGLREAGIDTDDVFEMLLALRRFGGRRLEAAFGPGAADLDSPGGRRPLVPATVLAELAEMASEGLTGLDARRAGEIAEAGLTVLVATSDVHEHGKMLIEQMLRSLGVGVADGGVSTEPEVLVAAVRATHPDAVAISTYNGVALTYYRAVSDLLRRAGLDVPVLIGGRLNQIPDGSNTSLPVDVGGDLREAGAIVCRQASELVPVLHALATRAKPGARKRISE
jgi:methylmalonyl-CoA mutase cobalamin-binding subunit